MKRYLEALANLKAEFTEKQAKAIGEHLDVLLEEHQDTLDGLREDITAIEERLDNI